MDHLWYNMKDLENDPTPNPSWLPVFGQDGFFIEGGTHLLAGHPKGGKTEFMYKMATDWPHRKILWFSEEPRYEWLQRFRARKDYITTYDHITMVEALGTVDNDPSYILKEFVSDYDIIIVDTIRNIIPIADENNNSLVRAALVPYVQASQATKKTLILVHHLRKAAEGANPTTRWVSSAHEFVGGIDRALILYGEGTGVRTVVASGRVTTPEPLHYRMDQAGKLDLIPQINTSVKVDTLRSKVLAIMDDLWRSTKDIYEMLPEPKPALSTLNETLKGLAMSNQIKRIPPIDQGNVHGKTVLWYKEEQPDISQIVGMPIPPQGVGPNPFLIGAPGTQHIVPDRDDP